jgi:penicillin-insensitive murein DD-endopeptidase
LATNLRYWVLAFALFAAGLCFSLPPASAQEKSLPAGAREAKKAFGAIREPAGEAAPRAIGQYDHGCVAGAAKLPPNGPGWQVMRLSRNRVWGHPVLLSYLSQLAADTQSLDGLSGILVGDMGQPIGGPLLGGHASHQIGLDVDLWYTPMPSHELSQEEREQTSAANMVNAATLTVDKAVWTAAQVKILRHAASYPEVARIFVHPAVKKALCDAAGAERAWLQKIRPWFRHDDHFHIRLNCPQGSPACVAQAPVAAGDDGCGKELDEWFKKLRAKPKTPGPVTPAKPVLVSDMPAECQALLAATESAEKARAAD